MTSTKTVSVNAEELRTAFEFVSFGAPLEPSSYICVDTGKIYCHSVSVGLEEEEDLPEDLETSDRYIAVPHKNDLARLCQPPFPGRRANGHRLLPPTRRLWAFQAVSCRARRLATLVRLRRTRYRRSVPCLVQGQWHRARRAIRELTPALSFRRRVPQSRYNSVPCPAGAARAWLRPAF